MDFNNFLRDGFGALLGDTFALLRAIGSIVGLFLIIFTVLLFAIDMFGIIKVKIPLGSMTLGCVLCMMFGLEYGLNYFNII